MESFKGESMFHTARRFVVAMVLVTVLPFRMVASSEDSSSRSASVPVVMHPALEVSAIRCSDPNNSEAYEDCEGRTIGELIALGPQGSLIARTRNQALQILQTSNECSAWFQQAEPNVEGVFRSLHFELDANGKTEVSSTRSDLGETLYKDPWGARTNEYAGSNATVQINSNGPFFVRASRVRGLYPSDTLRGQSGWHLLSIASYMGDSPEARLVIMLHELGHIVGRLPVDEDSWDGQSSRNTLEVLHHCKADIRAAVRKPYRSHN
jgi:hypothetical protein